MASGKLGADGYFIADDPRKKYPNTKPAWQSDPRGADYSGVVDQPLTPAERYRNTVTQEDDFVSGLKGGESHTDPSAYNVQRDQFKWGGRSGQADFDVNRYQGMGAEAQNRGLNSTYEAQQQDSRGYQRAGLGSAMDAMYGRTPSVAQQQMTQGLGQSQANAMSMAAGARGGGANQAAAMRAAMGANMQGANQITQQTGQLRADEMAQARGQVLSGGNAMRQGDFQAQNQYLQNRAGNDAYQANMENLGFNTRKSQLEGSMAGESLQGKLAEEARGRATEQEKFNIKQNDGTGILGGILGAMGMSSDERAKKNVSDGIEESNPYTSGGGAPKSDFGGVTYSGGAMGMELESPYRVALDDRDLAEEQKKKDKDETKRERRKPEDDFGKAVETGRDIGGGLNKLGESLSDRRSKKNIRDFADKLEAKTFEYKDPEPGMEGRMPGVMAQDMEKSKLGKSAIIETQRGKAIDIKKGLSLALASIAELKEELATLKGGKKNGRK